MSTRYATHLEHLKEARSMQKARTTACSAHLIYHFDFDTADPDFKEFDKALIAKEAYNWMSAALGFLKRGVLMTLKQGKVESKDDHSRQAFF